MHIAEGVLSPAVLSGGVALTAAGTAVALRKTDFEKLTAAAALSAAFFVGSLVHIPFGPGSVHLLLNGLLGLFLGWAVFPALLTALALQAVLFRYGGLAVLGLNVFNMAFPALCCRFLFRPLVARGGRWRIAGAFACGALSVAGAGVLTALSLGLSNDAFVPQARLILAAHFPLLLLEGTLTAMMAAYIARVRPELLPLRA